ncbi:MAG: hypothetical protein KDJ16_14350, partial [Hyphomicrobiales bacterium]|nr:hypothetical protein [Hyphomicrobiales bacterium]
MAQPARILVIDEKASADRAQIWGELDRFGFATRACAPIDVSRALRSAEPPDVVVVDGRSGISEHLLAAELETARNRGNGIPPAVLFLARDGDPNSGRLIGAGRV